MASILKRQPAPWHLWLVGALALLWNGFGAFDFTSTVLKGEDHLRAMGMGDQMISYFNSLPSWTYVAWGVGVWGGVIGAVLLLLRKRLSELAFALSMIGAVASQLISLFVFPPPNAGDGATGNILMYAIIVIAVLFWLYAFSMKRRAVMG